MDPQLVEGEPAKKQYQDIAKEEEKHEETSITRDDREGEPETPENKEKDTSGDSAVAAAEAKKERKKYEDAILVVATLIVTLTYQALLNPPSTVYNQGTEIDWGCLGKHPGRGLIKGMKECPAGLAFAFLFLNTTIFFTSVLIMLVTLRSRRGLVLQIGFILGSLTIELTVNYCILLMAFSYYTAYVAIPLCCLSFYGCAKVLYGGSEEPEPEPLFELPTAAYQDTEERERQLAIAEIEQDIRESGDVILIVATLIITLTYQALSNPPPTFFKQGNQIDWGCLGKHRGHGLIKGMKECPAGLAFAFLFINTLIALNSIILVARTLWGRRGLLLRGFIISLLFSYYILLMAFSYNTAYVAIPLCCLTFLLCLSSMRRWAHPR